MAISFVGSASAANALVGATSATVAKPAGTLNGDRLVSFVAVSSATPAIVPPAGWSEVVVPVNTTGSLTVRAFQKVAGGSEPASYVWTWTGTLAYVAEVLAYRGVGSLVGSSNVDGLTVLSHVGPSVLASQPASRLVYASAAQSLLAVGWAAQAGDTKRADVVGGLPVLLNVNEMAADGGPVAAGTYNRTTTSLDLVGAINFLLILAPVVQTVGPAGIGSQYASGAVRVDRRIAPVGTATAGAFGVAQIARNVSPVGITSGQGFGSLRVNRTVSLGGIQSGQTFGLSRVDESVAATGIQDAQGFGSSSVSSSMTIPTGSILSTSSTGSPVIGSIALIHGSPAGSTGIFQSPYLLMSNTISPPGIDAPPLSGHIQLSMTSHLRPAGWEEIAFGDFTQSTDNSISPAGIQAGREGEPVIGSTVPIRPASLDGGTSGTPSLTTSSTVSASGISQDEWSDQIWILAGSALIRPISMTRSLAGRGPVDTGFGASEVQAGDVAPDSPSIPSGEDWGQPSLTLVDQFIRPVGMRSRSCLTRCIVVARVNTPCRTC